MSTHIADVAWALKPGEDFAAGRYGRGHGVRFDGGVTLAGTASEHVVGKWAAPDAVDPEEMLVAALSSCHMLTFLHLARLAGFRVTAYRDHAEGVLQEMSPGSRAVTRVTLHPDITWAGETPDAGQLAALHEAAHEECFIANSVRTEIVVAASLRPR
ncbi:OsmC family protein [Methylobacterium sp. E-045]|uniref:OsmC family protein n=1 Tax=Methylobacterium sp. E-045 TaxID=2836575 RepID=UPI001FBA4B1D|nr:OsmC family protein [Methylobacterium sp. E-045]MCJ2130235.1 OsmC family protein [Methylobacterium sp. E-045]